MHLDHTLGQIHTYSNSAFSDNLVHGTSPFIGLRLMTSNTTNLGASTPLPEGGKSLRIPLERTSTGMALGPRGYAGHHPPRGPSTNPAGSAQLKR